MAKENTVLTIDVGGDNLKMAEFVFPPGGAIMLRKFAFRKLEEQEGMTPEEVFARNYREMLAEGGFVAKSVRLSVVVFPVEQAAAVDGQQERNQ